MRDFLRTVVPLGESIINKVTRKIKSRPIFDEDAENNESIHKITKHYEDKIKDALLGNGDIQEIVDYILESIRLIKIRHLNDEENKKLIFDQIIIFMNYLCLELRSKYLFNTLTNNDLIEFNKQTIGDNIKNLAQKGGKKSESGYYCVHYTLFFKKIFDELEKKINLGTSNYLFLEKDGLDHAGLVVTFQGKNYLVDTNRLNGKFMQPIDNIGKYHDRMKALKDFHEGDISYSSIQEVKDEYNKQDDNYYKVMIKTSDDLLSLLKSVQKVGSFGKIYKIFGNFYGVTLKISKEGIQFLGTFTYHFDLILNKEKLDNISDDELTDWFINHISYKTNKDSDKRIKVFNFEKKYIRDTLHYFSDKIDYSVLRKVLSNA